MQRQDNSLGVVTNSLPDSYRPETIMMPAKRHLSLIPALLAAALLGACGGGGSGASSTDSGSSAGAVSGGAAVGTPAVVLPQEPGAPALSNNIATDGFNWINYRRSQIGVAALARNSLIDKAAQGHSDYLKTNNTVSHDQVAGNPGFTGVSLLNRLNGAGYQFSDRAAYAYGEVIAGAASSSGFFLAEELITAIYHRFVILDPSFKEAGSGNAVGNAGYAYFTTDFAANNGYGPGLGRGRMVGYPFPGQTNVTTSFSSDHESPDPVPNQDIVGYPISVHADITATVEVQTFTVRPHGGSPMAVRLLTYTTDSETTKSVAAIIPLSVLAAGTVYDVTFTGTVDGIDASRSWSFTTR